MNKDIHLTGLGNGLVDIQFEISEEDLNDIGLRKGEMLLANAEKQKELLEKLSERVNHQCSGGSAANTIIAFSKFGGKAAYKTVLGNDIFGKFYAQEFKDLGIVLKAEFLITDPTGTCVVLITPDAERTMHTSLGATAKFTKDHLDEDIIARSEWLYVEGYEFSTPNGAEASLIATEMALKHNTKVAVTFSDHFITQGFRNDLLKVAEKSDLIFCNEHEAVSFTGEENTAKAFDKLCTKYKNVVVTKGASGSIVHWQGKNHQIPAYETKPLDTTGAGDMYAGGFLYGIISTGSAEKAGHLGSYASSRVVSQFGARLAEDHKGIVKSVIR